MIFCAWQAVTSATELQSLEAGLTRPHIGAVQHRPSLERRPSLQKSASMESTRSLQTNGSFKEGQVHPRPFDITEEQPTQLESQRSVLLKAWRQQFVDAVEYDSKASEDGEEPGGTLGLVLHFLSIFWKLCVGTTPPEWWLGGYPCFFACLLWIIAQVGFSRAEI